MANIEKGLKYCESRWHKPKYVMGGGRTRNSDGTTDLYTSTEDCSSFTYKYLIVTGALPATTMPTSTEGLFALGRSGKVLKEIKRSEVKRGDIFIAGREGYSAGAYGHTGVFLNRDKIIHCTPGPGGDYWTVITSDKNVGDETYWFNSYIDKNENPVRYYRIVGAPSESKPKRNPIYKKVIDLSEWQDPAKIDYDKLAKDIDGAILRTSYTYSKDKSLKVDKHFETHYKELSKRGVALGAYHFSRAINKLEAKKETGFMYEIIKDKKFSLPIYGDFESEEQLKTSMKDISTTIYYWCKGLEEKGYFVGFYCNLDFLDRKVQNFIKKDFSYWLANYTDNPNPKFNGNYDMWQYTNKGKVNGYSGDIDINRAYVDFKKLIPSKKLNGYGSVKKESKPIDPVVEEKKNPEEEMSFENVDIIIKKRRK